MTKVSVSQLRHNLRDFSNRVAYGGERIGVESHHKPLFALVSISDLEILEMLETKLDLELARQALENDEFMDWDKAKKALDL